MRDLVVGPIDNKILVLIIRMKDISLQTEKAIIIIMCSNTCCHNGQLDIYLKKIMV